VLLVAAVPWVIDNQTRPLVGFALPAAINPQPRFIPNGETIFNAPRNDLYFVKDFSLEAPYIRVATQAANQQCHEIALRSGPDDWEYPLWVLTREFGDDARIDQVLVDNASAGASRFGSKPCLLVSVTSEQPSTVYLDGVEFDMSWSETGVALYQPRAG
jgi:hypothetical protein